MSYKILSLDGGGSWALIQARILQDIYGDIQGHELLRKFDLVIANSGGSLVLACLCNNMRLSEIISVFKLNQKEKKFSFD
jgi:patatin-like phospholipase/acyl hydrolase